MNIVVAGGRTKADFLIESLLLKKHTVIAINDERLYCEYLAGKYSIPVIEGNPCDKHVMDAANITGFDVMIALRPEDAQNLAICQMASKKFQVKKSVCIVSNPRNVDIFKQLGVTNAISGTYMVVNIIERATTLDKLVQTLDLEDGMAAVTEVSVRKEFPVCDEMIRDMALPENVIISCIIRDRQMLVPNGSFIVRDKDKLIIISSQKNQEEMLKVISGGEENV